MLKRDIACFLLFFWQGFSGFAITKQDPSNVVQNEPRMPVCSWISDIPPTIYEVVQDPLYPLEGQSVNITVKANNDESLTDDQTTTLTLHYSPDGGIKWLSKRFKREEKAVDIIEKKKVMRKRKDKWFKTVWREEEIEIRKSAFVWTTSIPSQKRGTNVKYFITAKDTSGNVTAELPFSERNGPKTFVSIADRDEQNYYAIFSGNGKEELLPDSLDILRAHFASDAETVYVELELQGDIAEGTKELGYAYGAIIDNPDYEPRWKHDYLLNILGDYALVYSPLNRVYNSPIASLYEIQTYKQGALKDVRVKYEVRGDMLRMQFPLSALGNNPSHTLKLLFATAATDNMEDPMSKMDMIDCTPFLQVHFREHAYTVGE